MKHAPHDAPSAGPAGVGRALVSALVFGTVVGLIHGSFHGKKPERTTGLPPHTGAAPPPAGSPADLPASFWWSAAKHTFAEVNDDRVMAVAGGVTFYALLSLFPAITVMVSAYGLFAAPATISGHLQMLSAFLPEGAMSIIGEQVRRITQGDQGQLGAAAIAGLLAAVWSSNAAMKAMMDALNIAYDVEERRSFLWLNVESLAFTLTSIVALLVMLAVIALVPLLLHTQPLEPAAGTLISAGRWLLAFVLMMLALALLYKFAPNRPEAPWRWITPGSLLASAGLMTLSMGFSWYAANFGKFNETYGSLGAAIGFMTWLWLSAVIVMVGAELNAELEQKARKQSASSAGTPAFRRKSGR